MAFGVIIIGDEILSGKRQDRHFERVREILAARGLGLAWVTYLGDDRERIAASLTRSFAGGDVVFSTGGIGATPDDHTRQAAAQALGLPLVLHPEAERLIAERTRAANQPVTPERLRMGEFPEGAELIPNPYNRIPGFSIRGHYFVPGFPQMAWPMIEWVLDTHYRHLFGSGALSERSMIVRGLAEATLTPLMERVERDFPGVKVFSLPRLDPDRRAGYEIDLGVKGEPGRVDAAFEVLRAGTLELGGRIGD
jgi:molybdopterin-biosynthesis enzyme MoeA-like protein